QTAVTLVNLNKTAPRELVVQGGAYAEHRIESVEWNGRTVSVNSPSFTVKIAPGAGATLTLQMKRYSEKPTEGFPQAVREGIISTISRGLIRLVGASPNMKTLFLPF